MGTMEIQESKEPMELMDPGGTPVDPAPLVSLVRLDQMESLGTLVLTDPVENLV